MNFQYISNCVIQGSEQWTACLRWSGKSGYDKSIIVLVLIYRGERIIRYSNIIRILEAEYWYSYSYSGDFLKPNIIRIRIRVIFSKRILFVFVFG